MVMISSFCSSVYRVMEGQCGLALRVSAASESKLDINSSAKFGDVIDGGKYSCAIAKTIQTLTTRLDSGGR